MKEIYYTTKNEKVLYDRHTIETAFHLTTGKDAEIDKLDFKKFIDGLIELGTISGTAEASVDLFIKYDYKIRAIRCYMAEHSDCSLSDAKIIVESMIDRYNDTKEAV